MPGSKIDYNAFAKTAASLIAQAGMPMTFLRVEKGGEYIPGEGYPEIITRTDFVGVRTSPKAQELQAGLYALDMLIILMPGDAVPAVSTTDRIEFAGQWWDIESVAYVAPAEISVLWKIGVRLLSQKPIPPTNESA